MGDRHLVLRLHRNLPLATFAFEEMKPRLPEPCIVKPPRREVSASIKGGGYLRTKKCDRIN